MNILAGVDEAGRGPLCGDVFAAAVILDPARPIEGLADSKKLSEKKRERLALEIKEKALAWCIASASAEEIDTINILRATMACMARAVEGLSVTPTKVLIDGNRCPQLSIPSEAIVKGDSKIQEISAASILAKVARDESIMALHKDFPQYCLDQHKGYGTALHMEKLKEHGPAWFYRKTFAPVAALLEQRLI